jgi:drug/metabolite transporter (DMT)-like permease
VAIGPRLRWAGTVLAWATAPIAGLAILNLPTLVQMQTHDTDSGLLGAASAGLFVLAVAWSALAWGVSRLHTGVARIVHLAGCALLALVGLLYPYIYGLIGYLTYRDA